MVAEWRRRLSTTFYNGPFKIRFLDPLSRNTIDNSRNAFQRGYNFIPTGVEVVVVEAVTVGMLPFLLYVCKKVACSKEMW